MKRDDVIRVREREATVLPYTFQPPTMAERRRRTRNHQLLAALLLVVCVGMLGLGTYTLLGSIFGMPR